MTPQALKDLEANIKAKTDELQALVHPADDAEPMELADRETALTALTAEVKALHEQRRVAAIESKADDMLKLMREVDPAERTKTEDADDGVKRERDLAELKSVGEQFTDADAFKAYRYGDVMADVITDASLASLTAQMDTPEAKAVKALLQTSAGFEPMRLRLPNVVGAIYRPQQFIDRVRQVPVGPNETFEWFEQTTRTAPATFGSTAEGAVYQETAFQWAKRTAQVVQVTGWVPITEIQLADVPMVQDAVNSQLPMMLAEQIDHQIIHGPGGTDRIIGLTSLTNRQTRTKAADENLYDTIAKAMGDIWVDGRAMPDMILLHTLDYLDMMLEQTREGNYLFGMLNQMGQSPWGPTVVRYDALDRGTFIVGDFARYYILRDRQQLRTRIAPRWAVSVSVDDTGGSAGARPGTGLTAPTGQVMIFSDVRVQSQWLRPQAFVHVTS